MYYVNRNSREYGPYELNDLSKAFKKGDILKRDMIRVSGSNEHLNVEELLISNNIRINVKSEKGSSLLSNLLHIIIAIFSSLGLIKKAWFENKTILMFLAIVFVPVFSLSLFQSASVLYYVFAFYFAAIWLILIYHTFGTNQANIKTSIFILFSTGIISALIISIVQFIPPWSYFYTLSGSELVIGGLLGMFLGVGITEEFCKLLIIAILIHKSRYIITPQTAVYYGMISGLSFGIYEGIEYQLGINKTMEIDYNYFYNIIRLTSLPFIHAIWAGISSYLLALSFIQISYNYSFRIIAILLPAFLHAVYNTFGWSVIGLSTLLLSAVILMVFITKNNNFNLK